MHTLGRLLTTAAAIALTAACSGIGSAIVGGEHRRDAATVDAKPTDAFELDARRLDAPLLDAAPDAFDAPDAPDAIDALDAPDGDVAGCGVGLTLCAGACVDVTRSLEHCGACGASCGPVAHGAALCEAGRCAARCDPNFADCDGNPANGCEVDTNASVDHCGACGRRCTTANGAPSCTLGACGIASCDPGFEDCNASAVDGCETVTGGDVQNCGRCGMVCPAPGGSSPSCVMGGCGLSSCPPGRLDCDGMASTGCEVDGYGTANCGACGRSCARPTNARPACSLGVCGMGACDAGFADCDSMPGNGCEVNTSTTLAHCGACGRSCAPAQATGVCNMGVCAIQACAAGFADCDHDVANGCEVSTSTSALHCGGCGRACALSHATPRCAAGACQIDSCDSGYFDCDGDPTNGCEAHISSDAAHCGTCGHVCPVPTTGTAACMAGVCGANLCVAGRGNCDGSDANGCEADLTLPGSCGACGNACSVPNATAACRAGACAIGACNTGYSSCDGNDANGCEVRTATDLDNCGGCGSRCAPAHAAGICNSGTCGVGACAAGFADCTAADGCETNVGSNPSACGSCTRICMPPANASPMCASGDCRFTCITDYADCNGLPGDGCESYRFADNANCGSCGNACGAGRVCAAGACVCDPMRTMCGSACVNTSTDNANCGACGNACSAGQSCSGGSCVFMTCTDTGRLCAGTAANVCIDPNNCGACFTNCGATNICMGGVCVPCAPGRSRCGNTCVDLNNDSTSCGMCGFPCPAGQFCMSGSCHGPGADAGS